jgi:quercetin dioxygenase-like cupin family protein
MTRLQAKATLLIDNDRVRVTRFDFSPGAETGWHVHGSDYVVTPISTCEMLLEEPGGENRQVTMAPGAAYAREKGTEHNVINNGNEPMSFVEVELK